MYTFKFRYFVVNLKVMYYFTSYLKKVFDYETCVTIMHYFQHWLLKEGKNCYV